MPIVRSRFPFSAVVGQDDYKLALLANAVDPAIGGVLAVGERGTAKSTLARAFATLLPALIGDDDDAPPVPAPFVELPLGATVDRLTGALDTARLLAGDGAAVADGLLAAADGGVLYADEVNLLGDHLVDVLLDAAAFGAVRVERDGVSAEHDARFLLVGTMNPEEGALRPQLLDRFGLSVAISASTDTVERTEVARRRIEFERDPGGFCERFERTERALAEIVERARTRWADVVLPESLLTTITAACAELGVEGMRADIVTARTATALAALDERDEVIDRDIETAARLALPHRARLTGPEQTWFSTEQINEAFGAVQQRSSDVLDEPVEDLAGAAAVGSGNVVDEAEEEDPAASGERPRESEPEAADEPAASEPPPDVSRAVTAAGRGPLGRSSKADDGERPAIDARPTTNADDLDVIATARAAVTRRILQGSDAAAAARAGGPGSDVMGSQPGAIRAEDLRERIRSGREANLVLCVVDASSSVLEGGRSGELRALLGGLAADARRRRDRVGLIVFRGREARLVAPPSRNHSAVLSALETIEPGGTTPLAEGIRVARETALRELRRNPDLRPIVALVTDGHANVSRGGDAIGEARREARDLRRDGIVLVVIGESGSGAKQFALMTGAEYYPFDPPSDARSAA